MRILRTTVLLLGVGVASEQYAALKPAAAHKLRVTVSSEAIEVERATPGGAVLLIGYEQTLRDFEPVFRRVQRERPADASGSVTISLDRPIEPNSFWVAFDLESGGHGAVGGTKRALREKELPEETFRNTGNATKAKFSANADYAYILTIRPKVGAWELTAGDGGASDEDGSLNGKIEASTLRLAKSKHTSSDLTELAEGDVVAMFVPHQMGYLITRVKK